MANRLKDIVAAMKTEWIYGDKDFGYTFEVNEKHNTVYPYMMVNPPNSEIPEIYGGWEAYDFDIDFFDLYTTNNQQFVTLENEWDNLEDLALEWLNSLMVHYNNPTGSKVGIYFLEETVSIERVKEVANDRLVQLRLSFTMRAVTRCMLGNAIPNLPTSIQETHLKLWLSADANVDYDLSTGFVSSWTSRGDSPMSQAVFSSYPTITNTKPQRFSHSSNDAENYGLLNNKPRLSFPYLPSGGLAGLMYSGGYFPFGASGDFTIFSLAAFRVDITSSIETVFTMTSSIAALGSIRVGHRQLNQIEAIIEDGNGNTLQVNHGAPSGDPVIAVYRLQGDTLTLTINNQTTGTSVTTAGFNATGTLIGQMFIGSNSFHPTNTLGYTSAEIIGYDKSLSNEETLQVVSYINNKYEIF